MTALPLGGVVGALTAPASATATHHAEHLVASAAPELPVGPESALGQAQLDAAAAGARADWHAVRPSADLSGLNFGIADLPGLELGHQTGTSITVDTDAAGWGWSAMDLRTVLRHEIGHHLGYDHTGSGLMDPSLAAGVSHPVPAGYAEPTPEPAAAEPTNTEPVTTEPTTTEPAGSGGTTEPAPGSTDTGTGGTTAGGDTPGADATTTGATSTTSADSTSTGTDASGSAESASLLSATSTPLTGTTGDDTFVISDASGSLTITVNGGAPQALASDAAVTIDGLEGNDTVTISVASGAFTGSVTFTGGPGSDTLTAPDLTSTWKIAGVDAGDLSTGGGPSATFTGVEHLDGAATQADSVDFGDNAGLSGSFDDGAGVLTVRVADFATISGDFDFVSSTSTAKVVSSAGGTPVDTAVTVLRITGAGGTGFEGFAGLDELGQRIGLRGTLGGFTLAVVTDATDDGVVGQAWHAFSGTLASPAFVAPAGLDLSLDLDTVTVGLSTASENGSWVNYALSGVPGLTFTGVQQQATVPVVVHLAGFLHVVGDLTLIRGAISSVDIDTGLDATSGATSPIADVTVGDNPTDGTLARSSDYTKLWNLQVSSLQLSFTDASFFAGVGFGWTDANSDDVIQKAELASSAVGIFGGGIDLAFLLLTPIGGMPISSRFLGVRGRTDTIGLVGLGDVVVLEAQGLDVEANMGAPIGDGDQDATVDWQSSFPAGTGGTPGYVMVPDSDPGDTEDDALVMALSGPLFKISAAQVLLSVSQFLFVSGSFSMTLGGTELVDVDFSGLNDADWALVKAAIPVGSAITVDETNGAKILKGVEVGTTLIGIGGGTLFAGYDPSGFSADDPPSATSTTDAFGILATDIGLGLVLASPVAGQLGGYKLPSFHAMKAAIGTFTFLGIPTDYFQLSFTGLTVSVNSGGALKDSTGTSLSTVDPPFINWATSFADAGGLSIPTGSSSSDVLIDFTDPVIGVTATRVLLTIGDFLYISGSFSLLAGDVKSLDVDVHGISQTQWEGIVSQIGNVDPTDSSLGTTAASSAADARTVLNLAVKLTQIGIADATIFAGYAPGGFSVASPLPTDPDAFAGEAFGILASGIDVGMAFGSVVAGQTALGNYKFSSFFAMQADIDLVSFPGLPEDYFGLRLEGVRLTVNSGGVIRNGTTTLTTGASTTPATSKAVIDWAASYPDDGGLAVPTGATPGEGETAEDVTETVLLAMVDPIIGISADRITLLIGDFVHVSGSFSFVTGQQQRVDVDVTGISGLQWTALKSALDSANPTPGPDDLQADETERTILNLLVKTNLFGISDATIFVGYEPDGLTLDSTPDATSTANAMGILATGVSLGMVFASPVAGQLSGYTFAPFFALKGNITSFTFPGLPTDIVNLTFDDLAVSVNSGGVVKRNNIALSTTATGPATSKAVIDWNDSFTAGGLSIPTGTTTDPVLMDLEDPIVGISARLVVFSLSEFVYVSGGFSFVKGAVERVDVETQGLDTITATALATAVLGLGTDDPSGTTLGTNTNGTRIWNLEVTTTVLGISNANVFVGYQPGGFATGADEQFDQTDLSPDAVGLYAGGVQLGLVFAKATPGQITGFEFGTFYAIKAYIATLAFPGLPFDPSNEGSEFVLSLSGIALDLNGGAAIRRSNVPVANSKAVIDFRSSFTYDPDGEQESEEDSTADGYACDDETPTSDADPNCDDRAGYTIPTGEGNAPIVIDFHSTVIGISATRVVVAISDFVYISGGFSFRQGETELVDITTEGLPVVGGFNPLAASINGITPACQGLVGADSDPGGTVPCASTNGKYLWNIPVKTTLIGISDATIFIGHNPNAVDDSGTSFDLSDSLEIDDLSEDAVGLWASGISVGMVFASVVPMAGQLWRSQLPKFFAIQADLELLQPLGFPTDVLQLAIRGAGLSINRGGAVTGTPNSLAWVDWAHSFPGDGGLLVPTGTDNPEVLIDFEDPIIGVRAESVLIALGQYVYIEGGFSFVLGGRETVTVDTGLTLLGTPTTCGTLAAAVATALAQDPSQTVELSEDCRTLSGVPVQTVTIGVSDANVFLGYNPMPGGATFAPGTDALPGLSQADLSPEAIGLLVTNLNLGLVIANFSPSPFQRAISVNGTVKTPTFIALKAHAEFLGLVGLESAFNLKAWGATVEVNLGGRWTGADAQLATAPPVIDWVASFGDQGLLVDTGIEEELAEGEEAPPALYIDYDSYLIGGGVNRFVLSISDFVFLTGSFYFEFGPTRIMPLTSGLISTDLLTSLGIANVFNSTFAAECPEGTPDATLCMELQFLTIGAQDVYAFVGSGPYFITDEDGLFTYTVNGVAGGTPCDPDSYVPTGDDECTFVTDGDAVGLVLEDVDFALALMTPTIRLNPVRFIALQASAARVALVGINGMTVEATDLEIELNISTPTLQGLPVLPVVDFETYGQAHADESGVPQYFGVTVAAPAELGGDAVVVPFTFDSVLIKAQGTFDIDLFGVLVLRGSLAFALGPRADVTLVNGGGTVEGLTTITFGGSGLLGFIGINGPHWTVDADGDVIYTLGGVAGGTPCNPELDGASCQIVENPNAVGIGITDLNFGIFIGTKIDPVNPAVYVAANIDVTSFGFYGLESLGITALGTLALLLNIGLAIGTTTRLGAIDFLASFTHDPDGDQEDTEDSTAPGYACDGIDKVTSDADPNCDDLPGFAVPTGAEDHPIILDFDEDFIQVQLAGVINIAGVIQAIGVFFLEISPEGLQVFVNAQVLVGPDIIPLETLCPVPTDGTPHTCADKVSGNGATGLPTEPLLQIAALGVLIVNADGIAADFAVTLGLNVEAFSIDVRARLILNSTGVNQELRLPDRLYTFLSSQSDNSDLVADLLDRLVDCVGDTGTEERCYRIDGRAPKLVATNGGADEATINALLGLPGGSLTYEATGGAYVVVALYGSFEVLDFATATGVAALKVSSTAFEMVVSIDFLLGPSQNAGLSVHAAGALGIYRDGISLNVNVDIDANLFSIFDLDVTGTLVLDTTSNVNASGAAGDPDFFRLSLTGSVSVLQLITLRGTLDIVVADHAWALFVALGADFGPLGIDASGWIRSSGSFDVRFAGTVNLTIAGTGIVGSLSARAAFCDLTAGKCVDSPYVLSSDGTVQLVAGKPTLCTTGHTGCSPIGSSADTTADTDNTQFDRTFLISLTGSVEIKVFGVTLLGASITFTGTGSLSGKIEVKASFTVQLLFWEATITVKIASFNLPTSLVNSDAPPPNLGFVDSNGVLTLNVGAVNDGNIGTDRERISSGVNDEEYQVKQVSCDGTNGCTYVVTAFGAKQTFTGVKSIAGDFGDGDDEFVAFNAIDVPVTLWGGTGNDALAFQGSGTATLDGGAGNDYLRGGSGNDTITGGAGNDFIEGGPGTNTIIAGVATLTSGQTDDDTVYGFAVDLMGDTVTAGAGTDALYLLGATGAETLTVAVNGSGLRFTRNGTATMDATGLELLAIYTQGGDTVTLTGALNTAGLQRATVITQGPVGGVAGGTDSVVVNLTDNGDTTALTGGQQDAFPLISPPSGPLGVTTSGPAPQVATTTNAWTGGYTLVLSGTLLTAADLDTLTLNTLGGDDTVRILSLVVDTTVDTGSGNDTVKVGSHAATTNTGGVVDMIDAPLDLSGGDGTDILDVDDTGSTAGKTGTLSPTLISGLALHSSGIGYAAFETIGLGLGSGGDTLTITGTATGATTTVHGNAGNDTFDIQTVAGPTIVHGDAGDDVFTVGQPGTGGRILDEIRDHLAVHGGTGTDRLTASDARDTDGDLGFVTSSLIAGFDMADPGSTAPDTAWSVTISGSTGGTFTLTFGGAGSVTVGHNASAAVLQAAITALLGTSAVTVTRSPLTRDAGTTYLIRWTGLLAGAPPVVAISSALTGTGASAVLEQMSTGAIHHSGFETLSITLGSGADLVDLDSTPSGSTTTLTTGAGDDVVTIETTGGTTTVSTGTGHDSITVNPLTTLPTATNGLTGRLTLDGGFGSDTYTVQTFGNGDSRIDILDALEIVGGTSADTNYLIVDGSSGNDIFLLRKGVVANLNTPVPTPAGEIQTGFAHAEYVTYGTGINGSLVVNTRDGDDIVAFDDNSTITTVNGGAGNDSFFIGQLYGDTTDLGAGFPPEFTDTTRGMLTNGVSYATTINGGAGNDYFSVLRNKAVLQLNGEDGDDTFIVRTFAKEGSTDAGTAPDGGEGVVDPDSDAMTELDAGGGRDNVSYVMNAPVSINGGAGFDTVVVIGTEFDDAFVVSGDGVWGGGRYVAFIEIEKLDVDGAEGNDLFTIVSTFAGVETRIFGGLGSDTIEVGTAAPIVVADDLQGHSGIIEHSVESLLGNWAGVPVDGIATDIIDDDAAEAWVTVTDGLTLVREHGTTTDTVTIHLSRAPTAPVMITVAAPYPTPDELDAGAATVLLSLDGITWSRSVTMVLHAGLMSRQIWVRAVDDGAAEGERIVPLQLLFVQTDGDREYDALPLNNIHVRVVDNDRAGITVIADEPLHVTEGGATSSYSVGLASAPAGTVTVAVTPGAGLQVSLNGTDWFASVTLTFTTGDWDDITVHVRAINDATVEGSQFGRVSVAVLTGDGAGYVTGLAGTTVTVRIHDDDTPGIEVVESDGGTDLVEGGDTDSYQIRLTKDPGGSVTISATAIPTRTRNGDVIRDDVQVEVSLDGINWLSSVDLVFDSDTWDDFQTVYVRALDDAYADGNDFQAFARTNANRVFSIQGPLYVYGGSNPDADYTIPAPIVLPGESSLALVTTPNPNFDMIEENQVDRLLLDNSGSVADDIGTLTATRVTGLGMGQDETIQGRPFNGGVTYQDLELLRILLGTGHDTFTVESTHLGRTEIDGGRGDDTLTVLDIDGHTLVRGGDGDDDFLVGQGSVESLDALLVLDGGQGHDTADVDGSEGDDDVLATITGNSVVGMQMVARPGVDRVHAVTVGGSAGTFTITLAGYGTATLVVGATAAQVQAALQNLLFPDPRTCGLPAGTPGASTPAQDSRCSASVFVWKVGDTYYIGFTGELAGDLAPAFSSGATDLARVDGIGYGGLEGLTVRTGSGHDGVNVRGTTAATTVLTGAGDDLVFVSDSANLGNLANVLDAVDLSRLADALAAAGGDLEALLEALLHGTLTIDDLTFSGSLDLITGSLDIDTGAGSNTLAVSDRGDVDADSGVLVTRDTISGLAPTAITYAATGGDLAGQGHWTRLADSGLFGRGVNILMGSGGNTGHVGSVRGGSLPGAPYAATVTTIWTGEGDDDLTLAVDLPTGAARLVLMGQGGDDSIVSTTGATQPLVLVGGQGSDSLTGGAGNDQVFGDDGRVYHHRPAAAAGFDIVLGGAPVAGHLIDPRTGSIVAADNVFLTPDVIRTALTTVGTGDVLSGVGGNDVILGGRGDDTVNGGTGNDLVFGDFAWIGANAGGFVDATRLPLSMAIATHPFAFVSIDTTSADGGVDTIAGGDGNDILLGQQGGDTLHGDAGDDDVIGGHNVSGGADGGDTVTGGTGHDVVLGDNGTVLRTGSSLTTLVRVLVGSTLYLLDPLTGTFYSGNTVTAASQLNPTGVETRAITLLDHALGTPRTTYGSDTVDAGDGHDLVFGQLGDDVLRGGSGDDHVEGNGGNDTIHGGLGQDNLMGGSSSLFGLTTPGQRPDGSDLVYGGDGTLAGRNDLGDTSSTGHASDADVIVGDNGNIYRIIGSGGAFLSFTYDNYGALKVIPRVVQLLDYSPTGGAGYWDATADPANPVWTQGTRTNIGAGDFLHGEGGDDIVHGMTGDDALFGDGQDDDLYGEEGEDWISGGAGIDGILGDDGRIITSRNGSTEPLLGLTQRNRQETVRGSGPQFTVTIFPSGELHKGADLEPFHTGYDDIVFGGLGNDFIHGGVGDDALSGAEATAEWYTADPLGTLARYHLDDDPLLWNSETLKFLYYNPNNPRQLIRVCAIGSTGQTDCRDFFLTNDASENDGADAIFGDSGNDWIVGGTGSDHLYGGWGFDLLNADDDMTTNAGANDIPDTPPAGQSYGDFAYGGAAYDVLIGNTQDERLIDWLGEYNSYVVPFNPFGSGAVWRSGDPGTVKFLYAMSGGDGADQTRGGNVSRNSEPYGELGLVLPEDPQWGDQSDTPQDPQPGNGGSVNDSLSTTYTLAADPALPAPATADDPAHVAGTIDLAWVADSLVVGVSGLAGSTTPTVITVVVTDAAGIVLSTSELCIPAGAPGGAMAVLTTELGLPAGSDLVARWEPVDDPAGSTYRLVVRVLG